MKKILITGINKIPVLTRIFEDIMATSSIEVDIETLGNHSLMLHVGDDHEEVIHYAIANVDKKPENIPIDHIPLCRFITLGLNKKSSVTISSLEADSDTNQVMIYCIQREIGEGKHLLEPQEFPVFIRNTWGHDVYMIMSAVTAAMLIRPEIRDQLTI